MDGPCVVCVYIHLVSFKLVKNIVSLKFDFFNVLLTMRLLFDYDLFKRFLHDFNARYDLLSFVSLL